MKRKSFLLLAVTSLSGATLLPAAQDFAMWVDPANPTRAVVGSTATVTYRLFNNTADDIDFTLTPEGNNGAVTGPASPISGGIGPAPQTVNHYSFLADTSGLAGSLVTTGLTANEVLPGIRTASATQDIRLLENRTINFSLSSGDKSTVAGVLDLGRYIGNNGYSSYNPVTNSYSLNGSYSASSKNLTLSINGGTQDHNLATDVTYNPKDLSKFVYNQGRYLRNDGSTTGIWLSSYNGANQATTTFNAANQTATATISFYRAGQFSETYQFGSAANLGTAFHAESGVAGAAVGIGNSVTITGASLSDRLIVASSASGGAETNGVLGDATWWTAPYFSAPDTAHATGRLDGDSATPGIQSRVMVGAAGNIAAGSETWSISSPGGDNNFARVNFTGSGTVTNGYLSVDTGSGTTLFNGTSTRDITATWTGLTYGTGAGSDFDTTVVGRHTNLVNLTSNLSSGETGGALAGQNMGNLNVGYTFEVVNNRVMQVNNLNKTALSGTNVTLINAVTGSSVNATNPTAHFEGGGSEAFSSNKSTVVDSFNVGTAAGSGTRTVTFTPEGLVGEVVSQDKSYNWSLNRINAATVQASGSLVSTDFVSITRTNQTGLSQSVGTYNLFQTNSGAGTASAAVYARDYLESGWSASHGALGGSSASFNFVFNDAGLSNGTYFGYYEVIGQHADQAIIGTNSWDLGYKSIWFEAVVSGREDTTAYKGLRLANFESTAPPTVSATVQGKTGAFEILDIVDTTQTRGIAMQVLGDLGTVSSDGKQLGFVAGSISGLDGITFVLQSTYDETAMVSLFGSEEQAVLLWEKSSGVFVNAVLGNHGDAVDKAIDPVTGDAYHAKIGQRFVGSYAAYLLAKGITIPKLGDYGYDSVANTVWAVIDHNSTFGGGVALIPEPSSFLLISGGCLISLFRRRRV